MNSKDVISQAQSDFEKLSKDLSNELKVLKQAKAEYEKEIEDISKELDTKPEFQELLTFYVDALASREEEIKRTRQDLFELVHHYEEYVKSLTAYEKSSEKAQLFLDEVQDKRDRDNSRIIDLIELTKENPQEDHEEFVPKSSKDKLF